MAVTDSEMPKLAFVDGRLFGLRTGTCSMGEVLKDLTEGLFRTTTAGVKTHGDIVLFTGRRNSNISQHATYRSLKLMCGCLRRGVFVTQQDRGKLLRP